MEMKRKNEAGFGKVVPIILVAIFVIGGAFAYIFVWYGPITVKGEVIAKQQTTDAAWAQVQNQYQRRFDLLPKLFQIVEAHMAFEKTVQTAVAAARSAISGAYDPNTGKPIVGASQGDQIKAMQAYDNLVITVRSVVEATPQLRSIEAVKDLMTQLEGTENRIAVERGRYIDVIRDYNTFVMQPWPVGFFNSYYNWGYVARPQFEAVPRAQSSPDVKLNPP